MKNILFVMADQLRWDYLSCYGHPYLDTPNIDRLAEKGVKFTSAYVSSPVCGPSRASFYTGRTAHSHGATWNRVPLPIGEMTIGEYLKPLGYTTAVVGKTHMAPDSEAIARLGIDVGSEIGVTVSNAGFEPFDRDDGLNPDEVIAARGDVNYNVWLRSLGYDSENPWHDYANSALGPDGELRSGWYLENAHLPARIPDEHSETAYMTDRAMEFIEGMGDNPWLCHLSFIKPHWPYMVSAPYHDMFGPDTFSPVVRSESEPGTAHPVMREFMRRDAGESFADLDVRANVLGAYMGLVKQIDDHLGRLFSWLDQTDRTDNTMIVFTSDHGDYLGDHWLGEKELFHEPSVKVPLIVVDPSPEADSTRGSSVDEFVECIDIVPTFLAAAGAPPASHRVEGESLMGFVHGDPPETWRQATFSEIDWAFYEAGVALDVDLHQAKAFMIRNRRWKYVYFKRYRPQLFDLEADPNEFYDLGGDPAYANARAEMMELLVDRLTSTKNRIASSNPQSFAPVGRVGAESGIIIGVHRQPE